MKSKLKTIGLSEIRVDGGTQPRTEMNEAYIGELVEAYEDGKRFPPLVVFHDGKSYWLADGFHRYWCYTQVDHLDVEAEVHKGRKRDAILYSVGANAEHGLRRSNDDKRSAVMTLLEDEEWGEWSNREIARRCAVSEALVRDVRKTLTAHMRSEKRTYTTRHGTTATMNTANIGQPEPIGIDSYDDIGSDEGPSMGADDPTFDGPTDFEGNVIPEHLREAFDGAVAIDEGRRMVSVLKGHITRIQKIPAGAALSIEQKEMIALDHIGSALKFAVPYAVCPSCGGDGCKSGGCKGRGWVTQKAYESWQKANRKG